MTFVELQTPLEMICSLATQLELHPAARRSDGVDALQIELANLAYAVSGVRGAARSVGIMAPDLVTRAALVRDLSAAPGHLRALLLNTELAVRTGVAGVRPLLQGIAEWGTALARALTTAVPPAVIPESLMGQWPQPMMAPPAWPLPWTADPVLTSLPLVDVEGTLAAGDDTVERLCHFTTRLRISPEAPALRGLDLFAVAVAALARDQIGSNGALRRARAGEWTPEVAAAMVLGYRSAAEGVHGIRALLEPLARSAGPEARTVIGAMRDLLPRQEKVLARTQELMKRLLGSDGWAMVNRTVLQARRARWAPYLSPPVLGGQDEEIPRPGTPGYRRQHN